MAHVHPNAMVDSRAELAQDVEVGAFAVIGPEVRIGTGTRVAAHALIVGRTTIGARNRIFQFTSIGDIPQDRKYGGEPTATELGDDNVVREYTSIHAGTTQDRGVTSIGNGNWLLAYAHIAHDCVVGDYTTFSNNAQLAGHVEIGDYVTLGGYVGVHQFCRIGAHAMVAAGAIVLQDVPPFVTAAGSPAKPAGTNNEGLRRRGFAAGEIAAVRRAYRVLYRDSHPLDQAKALIAQAAVTTPALQPLVTFLSTPDRGRGLMR